RASDRTTDAGLPTITSAPTGSNLGCNPLAASLPTDAGVKALVTASATCSTPTINVSHNDTTSGCVTTRSFSISATDSCGNVSATTTVAYTWTTDAGLPTITSAPTGSNLGCNPLAASLPTDASVKALVTASDTCSTPTINVSHNDTTSGCVTTRSFSISATDSCGNVSASSAEH